jgi:hypothetical protein
MEKLARDRLGKKIEEEEEEEEEQISAPGKPRD